MYTKHVSKNKDTAPEHQ